jgi:5-methylcytosine-specific restriction enzyme A
MPSLPKIICNYPGCSQLAAQNGYCKKHQNSGYHKNLQRHSMYGRKWQTESKKYLAEHPWCEDCMKKGVFTVATEVHHKRKHQGNSKLFWDKNNWQGLCHSCHSKRTARGE